MIAVLGRSGSGKSTLIKEFLKKNKEFKRVVVYTTRPPRNGEISGDEYRFVTVDKFLDMVRNGEIVASSVYNGWFYGILADSCKSKNSIGILPPALLRELKRIGYNIHSVLLHADRRQCLIATLNRGDSIEEAYRRNLMDEGMFDGVDNEVDAIVLNNMTTTIEEIANNLCSTIRHLRGVKDE